MKNNNTLCQDVLNADALHQASILDEKGNEQTITREMIDQALDQLSEPEANPKS